MSREVVIMLSEMSPLLKNWIESEFHKAIHKDFHEFTDEPHAMIGLIIFEQSIAGFAKELADGAMEALFEQLQNQLLGITNDMLKEWI